MNEPHKFRSVALLVCRTFFRDRLKQLTDSPSHHAEAKTAASPWMMMLAVAAAAALLIPAQTVSAAGACSDTAQAAFIACKNEVKDDEWIGRGNCYNVSDPDEQTDCLNDLAEETKEESGLCAEQRHTRLELCSDLTTPPEVAGDVPYDPDFSPFVDPADIDGSVDPNPFFPLVDGYQRVYRAYETEEELELVEQITVTVPSPTSSSRRIRWRDTCIVRRWLSVMPRTPTCQRRRKT